LIEIIETEPNRNQKKERIFIEETIYKKWSTNGRPHRLRIMLNDPSIFINLQCLHITIEYRKPNIDEDIYNHDEIFELYNNYYQNERCKGIDLKEANLKIIEKTLMI
jgi:hypothetical protein